MSTRLRIPVHSLAQSSALAGEAAALIEEVCAQRLAALAASHSGTRAQEEQSRGVPIVTIDGYSGSGKTTFARALKRRLGEEWGWLSLDDWYPGWDGLAQGASTASRIATDLRAGRPSSYHTWDWEHSRVGKIVYVECRPSLLEGCGANEAPADVAIWLENPGDDIRRDRALARDGDTYAPHWWRWEKQDRRRVAR